MPPPRLDALAVGAREHTGVPYMTVTHPAIRRCRSGSGGAASRAAPDAAVAR